jgi:hypothetical protein
MKTVKWFVSIALVFGLLVPVVKGITIDGIADPTYGPPLAVQTLGSNASATDPTNGNLTICSGSQLDAAYGIISNSTLYLVLAGNLQNDPNGAYATKLSIFIANGAPGQNTLANNGTIGSGPDFGAIPRMSAGGDPNNCAGCPGLTFDTGFNAAYWIGVSYGGTTNPSMSVNYFDLTTPNGANAYFLGNSTPTNGVLVPSGGAKNPFGIQATINDSNIGGVDTNLCNVNTNGAAQSIAAATVRTGVELAIPLSALGGPSIVGPVNVCAFLTTNDYSSIYDQLLGPVSSNGCVDGLAFGEPNSNNFSVFPGTHYFTVPVAQCNYSVGPASVTLPVTGGTGSFEVAVLSSGGGCTWAATSSVSWITITAGSSGSGAGTVSYSVAANPNALSRNGTISVAGTGPSATNTFTVTEAGTPLGIITVDGTVDAAYGCPVSVQLIATSYGKNTSTNIVAATGSELDAAYGLVNSNVLFLLLAGNIQDNGNRVHIFFMTGPGGQNTLTNVNPNNVDVSSGQSVLNWMGPTNSPPSPGLTFDTGFAPNYWMDVSCSATLVSFNYAQLWPGGTNASGVATNGYFLGSNGGGDGSLAGGTNPFGIQATVNNSNTNGVDAGNNHGGCSTNALGVVGGEYTQALTVATGIEMGIPLAALGSPTGTIAICVFVGNNGVGVQMSNQILGPFGTNCVNDPNDCCMMGPGRTENTPAVDLATLPGQHYFYVGPEMRVASVSLSNTDVHVTYLTENNTNLLYRLERTTSPLTIATTNNAVWSPVPPGYTNGTGGFINAVDTKAGTNKPAVFYRVEQVPNCTPP